MLSGIETSLGVKSNRSCDDQPGTAPGSTVPGSRRSADQHGVGVAPGHEARRPSPNSRDRSRRRYTAFGGWSRVARLERDHVWHPDVRLILLSAMQASACHTALPGRAFGSLARDLRRRRGSQPRRPGRFARWRGQPRSWRSRARPLASPPWSSSSEMANVTKIARRARSLRRRRRYAVDRRGWAGLKLTSVMAAVIVR